MRFDVGVHWCLLSGFSTLLVVFFGGLNGNKVPKLIVSLVNVVLKNIFAFFSLSSSNIESSVAGVGLDKVGLFGPFSFLSESNFEPATGMLILVNNDLGSIVRLVLEET